MEKTMDKKNKSKNKDSKRNETFDKKAEKLKEKGYELWKIGTWNIKTLTGKELELEEEFEEMGLNLLAITETKKKGKGTLKLEKGNILIYSGVEETDRAAAGVGCIIHKKLSEQVHRWQAWSERILEVEINDKVNKEMKTIIVVYGPNEDEKAEIKDAFWEDLAVVTEQAKGKIWLVGDFNSRVGREDEIYRGILGKYGENVRNNNGIRC